MESEGRKIISRTSIYSVGRLVRGLTGFLMLPIYTRYLSPADYGTIELLSMAIDIAAMLFGARVTVGMFRFYEQEKSESERKKVITTSLYLTTALNTLCIIALTVFSAQFARALFGEAGYALAFSLFSLTLVLGAVSEVGMGYLRILDRPYWYVGLSILRLLIQLTLNIYFIVYLEMTFMGVIYSAVISSAIMAAGLVAYIFTKNGFSANWALIKPMVTFSIPIILASLAMFVITFGDRYLLRVYQGVDVVGIYALAYKFGLILFSLVWAPFMTYWESKQFQFANTDDGKAQIATTCHYLNVVLILAALGISIFSKEVIFVMADPAFHNAAAMVPFITFAYVFQAWSDYHRIGLLHTGATKYIAYSTYITALVILILYFALIPKYGAYGAAIATAIAMFVRFYLIYYWSQKCMAIPYNLKPSYIWLAASIAITAPLLSLDVSIATFLLKATIYAGLTVLVFYSPLIDHRVREEVIDELRGLRRKLAWRK